MLHGGAVMAFADTLGALGTLANLTDGGRTATIESKTNFISAAPVGSRIVGETLFRFPAGDHHGKGKSIRDER